MPKAAALGLRGRRKICDTMTPLDRTLRRLRPWVPGPFPCRAAMVCLMSRSLIRLLTAFSLLAMPGAGLWPALAAPALVGSFQDWDAYSVEEPGGLICYAISSPKSTVPVNARRGDVFFMVTHRTAKGARYEVSIAMGYGFKPQAPATVELGQEKLALTTRGDGAWLQNAAADKHFTDLALAADGFQVKATSERNVASADNYSLRGFGQAIAAIDRMCKPK